MGLLLHCRWMKSNLKTAPSLLWRKSWSPQQGSYKSCSYRKMLWTNNCSLSRRLSVAWGARKERFQAELEMEQSIVGAQ